MTLQSSVMAIVALYDASEKMVNVSYTLKDIAIGNTENLGAGFKLPDNATNYKVKLFVWSGRNLESTTMQPLSNIVTLP